MSSALTRLIVAVVVVLTVAPAPGEAQPAKRPRVGLLSPHRCDHPNNEALRRGLRELGYVEGQTLDVECRGAEGKIERLPDLTRELLAWGPDVIVTDGTVTIRTVQRATRTVPIVMGAVGDPVGSGFVQSLARPGGNTTGLTLVSAELNPKRLEFLKELLPGATRIALLVNPENPNRGVFVTQLEAPARSLGVRPLVVEARGPDELDGAFETMVRGGAGGLLVLPDPILFGQRQRIVALAERHRIPAMYEAREFVRAGGLLGYGPNIPANFHRAAAFVDRILKGAIPADLPVEQPVKFDFAVNLRTARSLGLAVPPALLLRADEVIE
jgi:putative ABC transport system substrate-binding protein